MGNRIILRHENEYVLPYVEARHIRPWPVTNISPHEIQP